MSKHSMPVDMCAESDALTEDWGVWLSFRYGFNLSLHDARVVQIPASLGVHRTLAKHRAGLLQALEAGDTERAMDKCELLERTVMQAMVKPIAITGVKVRKGRADANQTRAVASKDNAAEWQRRAEVEWAKLQHANKGPYAIARLIAEKGEKPNTIRRKIKKSK
jgi:hypothetical protein